MAANCVIEQHPIGFFIPVGQELIFVVSNRDAVANETKVKFCAEVHIGTTIPVTATSNDLKGVFKTTPNNAGVGMFDLRNVIENYVKADNMAANGSSYKGTTTSDSERHPVHLIDKYSLNTNLGRYMVIQFYVEYLNTTTNVIERAAGTTQNSEVYFLFNGYVKHTDSLFKSGNNFGFDTTKFIINGLSSTFLTNAPELQYANVEDYGTMSFVTSSASMNSIALNYYSSTYSLLGTDTVVRNSSNGAWDNPFAAVSENQILHLGCFPGNLRNWSSTFQALVTAGTIQGGFITVQAYADFSAISKGYNIIVNCPDTKNFESIRLCWLNQWGAWDYYTFTKKSIRSTSTQGSTYHQLGGSWNESLYRPDSFKGGKKSFRVNATERITMNTNFVSEDDNVMFEELINSPEVYLLEGYQTDAANAVLNNYVTPVRLTTSSLTKKTLANDKLIQYTFEIEKSKTLRTQSI